MRSLSSTLVSLTVVTVACLIVSPPANSVLVVDGLFMLKNDHGARASGMGAAVVAIGSDANGIAYNPAAAVGLDKFTASFGHTVHWENIRMESAFFGTGLSTNLYLHGGIRYGADDDIEKRGTVPTADPEALFDAHDISFKAGLAYRVSPRYSVGAAMGWFIEEIEGYRGSAFNIDLGAQAKINQQINLGASVTNLGSSFTITKANQRGSNDIPLPTAWRVGGSYLYRSYYRGALELVYADDEMHAHFGAEAQLHKMLDLRTGYMAGYDTKNFTAGTSFRYRNIVIDYAFVPFTSNLGTSHLFNITFSL
ncbi:MAG: PorV/PorQ family protein [candidate division Zixibacteria bacterium]|nr:PorV/PorQ family protein [candidate division Zixibacteria bacterium]MDH4035128.1 PorV/PorQ family protein [candidate division Zixibacteria bacterium]